MTRPLSFIALSVAYLAMFVVAAGAGPTTKPGSQSPEWIAGWTAAGGTVAAPVVVPPVVQPATKPVIVGPIALDPLVKAAKPGAVLNLVKGDYFTAGSLIIPQAGLTILFNGSTLSGPMTGAWLIPTGAHITVDGLVVAKGSIIFNPQGDWFTANNCQIGVGSAPGAVIQAVKTGPHGTNCAVNNTHIGRCQTVGYYGDRGGETATNTIIEPSVDEYCLRLETPDGVIVPDGGCFTSCTFIANTGPNAKDAAGVRKHTNVRFVKCTFVNNDIRWAQSNQPPTVKPGQFASGSMENCTFNNIVGRSAIANLQGGQITVTGCIFNHPDNPPIAADSMSMTTYGSNVQNITAGQQPKVFFTSPHGGASVYTGGDVVNIVPK